MPFAQLSKARLEYFAHGEGPERVAFIHGFQASARVWRMTQEALPSDRYQSVAINNRGAGASDAPESEADYGVPIFAKDAFELLSQLGWRDFTLVGHSLGGATVAQFAVDHPSLLKGLVLLDPSSPDGREPPAGGPTMDELIDQRMAARKAQLARGEAGDGLGSAVASSASALVRELAADMRAAPEARLRGSLRSMFELRLGPRVRTLPMPVLVACGDADETIPLASMLATWAKYPPGTGLHVWHGVGHSPNLDCPDELAGLLRRFIETTLPARTRQAAA
jgi:branched-chain amino acid transport system permease protein